MLLYGVTDHARCSSFHTMLYSKWTKKASGRGQLFKAAVYCGCLSRGAVAPWGYVVALSQMEDNADSMACALPLVSAHCTSRRRTDESRTMLPYITHHRFFLELLWGAWVSFLYTLRTMSTHQK